MNNQNLTESQKQDKLARAIYRMLSPQGNITSEELGAVFMEVFGNVDDAQRALKRFFDALEHAEELIEEHFNG